MALSSDAIVKQEILDTIGVKYGRIFLRIFPQTSRQDQDIFSKDGLTFGFNGMLYGSCDACWCVDGIWVDGYDGTTVDIQPVIALEGTDALNRNSTGDAQYQRFHHVLGAVKNGIIGIYYLRKGKAKIRPELFGMAYIASKVEKGPYLVIDDLRIVKRILALYDHPTKLQAYIKDYLDYMFSVFDAQFKTLYQGDWERFANRHSTVIKDDCVIKYSGRNQKNFTEGSQRAGHIAVGEMYLTKYHFYGKKMYYLFLRMTKDELKYLDEHKADDKEWHILRHEPNVEIKTIDDIVGLDSIVRANLMSIKDEPLSGGEAKRIYNKFSKNIFFGLKTGTLHVKR